MSKSIAANSRRQKVVKRTFTVQSRQSFGRHQCPPRNRAKPFTHAGNSEAAASRDTFNFRNADRINAVYACETLEPPCLASTRTCMRHKRRELGLSLNPHASNWPPTPEQKPAHFEKKLRNSFLDSRLPVQVPPFPTTLDRLRCGRVEHAHCLGFPRQLLRTAVGNAAVRPYPVDVRNPVSAPTHDSAKGQMDGAADRSHCLAATALVEKTDSMASRNCW